MIFFAGNDIFGILPWSDNELFISVSGKSFFIYDKLSGKTRPFENTSLRKATNDFFKTKTVYSISLVYDDIIAIATLGDGVFFITKQGKIIQHFDSEKNRLISDNIVTNIYVTQEGRYKIVWLTTLNGITKIEFDLPIYHIGKQSGLSDIPVKVINFNSTFYFPTFSGLLKLSYETNYPNLVAVPLFENKTIYSVENVEHSDFKELIVGTSSSGIYEIFENGEIKYINGTENIIPTQILYNKSYPNSLFIGSERGIKKLNRINDTWQVDTTFFPDISFVIQWLAFDKENNLWMATLNNGVIKINLNTKQKSVYGLEKGLPTKNGLVLQAFNGKIFVLGNFGIYSYNQRLDRFQSSTFFGEDLATTPVHFIYQTDSLSFIIGMGNNRMHKIIVRADTVCLQDETFNRLFKRLPEMIVKDIYMDSTNTIWIASSEGIYVVLPVSNYIKLFNSDIEIQDYPYYVHLSRFTETKDDSSYFFGNFPKIVIGNDGDTLFHLSMNQPDFLKLIVPYKYNDISFRFSSPYFIDENNILYSYKLEGFNERWSKWTNETKAVYTNLKEGDYTFMVRGKNVFGDISEITKFTFEIDPPWYRTIIAYILYIIIIITGLFLTIKIYTRKLERDKKRLEQIVKERTAEIVKQKAIIEEKNKDITDSIQYAKQIQVAVLPAPIENLNEYLEFFIYFQPKDIVSGDFYFVKFLADKDLFIAAAVDCTGHGVPGAFMSLLGVTFLNEIINNSKQLHSDQVLNLLRENVIRSLNQEGNEEKKRDGMDMALITYNLKTKIIEFSGANNPLYLFRDNDKPSLNSEKKFQEDSEVTMYEFKPDKMPIGLHTHSELPFGKKIISAQKGDMMYIFSDGFADQFGGERGKKYTYKRFKRFLLSIHKKTMDEQEKLIRQEIINWQGEEEQIDDHIIIGIRIL